MSAPDRLRVPQQDGAVLAVPPLEETPALVARNRRLLVAEVTRLPLRQVGGGELLGRPVADLQREARQTAVTAAGDYLRAAGEPVPPASADSLLLAGHQPELFHPGVWVKHFALSGLARAAGATPINLVVDNDTAKTNLLRVPALIHAGHTAERLFHIESIPFDLWLGEAPYEERAVHDEALFASLPERVGAVARDWPFRPLLPALWEEVMRQAWRTPLLGERFASARRALERAWGCHNLELPVSVLCETAPFAWFACHLLAELPRFHALYNETVRRYRRAHGIRSRNHPVADLAAEGDWLEAPFWGWRVGESRRGRLLVRLTGSALELRAGARRWPSLPPPAQGAEATVAAWRQLAAEGFKVRSRALTNTLFARVFLADLFVHGIGGGKYDELTDVLIRGFYGIEPPAFLILSATLRLPFAGGRASTESCRDLQLQLRDLHWNPQRHLAGADPTVTSLSRQKQAWIAQQPADRRGRRERFQALRELTERLRRFVAAREEELRQELAGCERRQGSAAVLGRRDYAFCLYPEERLRPFCTRFLGT